MIEKLTQLCLALADPVLGWLLRLPWELAVVIVALATALVLRGVRLFTTDQELLRRIAGDKRRLKELMREAKSQGNREALARFRETQSQIAMRSMGQEWKPLLISLVPVAILATWCFARLEFHPPKAGESVDVVLYTPVSAIGEFVHLVPADGVEADGWIRTVEPDIPATNKPPANGISVWKVRAAGGTYPLVFRIGETTVTHEFRAGQTVYTEALRHHSDGYATQLRMREARFFGVVPGIPQIGLTPWLVAYLLIVCAAFPVIRKVTGIL